MVNTKNNLHSVSPAKVLDKIAGAIPESCHQYIIIIGSLAVGYHYFSNQERMIVRTKDADCLLSPRVNAVSTGVKITEQLLDEDWTFMKSDKWNSAGKQTTPDDELPAVRLRPPGTQDWFLELLTVPENPADRTQKWIRLRTRYGHFGICSFGFLSLANYRPIKTRLGIYIARPEMMALANLLEHPTIGKETMSAGFVGRLDIKRSNKDLGRVLAIARLALGLDEDALLNWPKLWENALKDQFRDDWLELSVRSGKGLRALLNSEQDLTQAMYTCVNGLLASNPPTLEGIRIAGRRLLQDAIKPLEELG